MDGRVITPDLDWARSVSREQGLPTRCPFASSRRCPRYFESLSLLGEHGVTTKLPPDEDAALLARWSGSDLWPEVTEKAASVFGYPDKWSYANFCPEVAFDAFGYFAMGLFPYHDEIDQGLGINHWERQPQRPRWYTTWESVQPLHYTDCPLYSLIGRGDAMPAPSQRPDPGLVRKIAVLCKDHYTLQTIDDLFIFAGASPDNRGSIARGQGSQRMDRVYEWVAGLEEQVPDRVVSIIAGVAAQLASSEEVPESDREFLRHRSGTSAARGSAPVLPAQQPRIPDSVEALLEVVIRGIPKATHPWRFRRKGATEVQFGDEYDLQSLFHSLIAPWVSDIRAEEYTPSYAGSSARVDFLLAKHEIVVELKHVRDRRHAKKVGEELIVDIAHYASHPTCQSLWAVVYDPQGLLQNPDGLIEDLEGPRTDSRGTLQVRVWVLRP